MVHIGFIFGLVVYSFSFIDLIVLSVLWKKGKDIAILWTIILMAVFTYLMIFQLINNYIKATAIPLTYISSFLDVLNIIAGISAVSLIYITPRFSIAMSGYKKWTGWLPGILIGCCTLLGVLYLLLYFKGTRFRHFSYILIFSTLGLSLFITLSLVIYVTKKDENSEKEPWYTLIAVSMAKFSLILLPFFFLLDFYQGNYPWVWLNRVRDYFSGIPILCLIWNIKLIRGAFQNLAHLQVQSKTKFDLEKWFLETGLTERETEVVYLLIEGSSYEEICKKLFLSKSTIKSHTNRIYRKTGLKNRISLLKMIQQQEN